MNKLYKAPCKDCEKSPCGAYHDKCYAYQEYSRKMKAINAQRTHDNIIKSNSIHFWSSVRKSGLKIGNHGNEL